MWVLLLLMLTPTDHGTYFLEKYDGPDKDANKAACVADMERVAAEMEKAYPSELDQFELVCKLVKKQTV
jgi:hypothetical protein